MTSTPRVFIPRGLLDKDERLLFAAEALAVAEIEQGFHAVRIVRAVFGETHRADVSPARTARRRGRRIGRVHETRGGADVVTTIGAADPFSHIRSPRCNS